MHDPGPQCHGVAEDDDGCWNRDAQGQGQAGTYLPIILRFLNGTGFRQTGHAVIDAIKARGAFLAYGHVARHTASDAVALGVTKAKNVTAEWHRWTAS